jgi:hypothetical protein
MARSPWINTLPNRMGYVPLGAWIARFKFHIPPATSLCLYSKQRGNSTVTMLRPMAALCQREKPTGWFFLAVSNQNLLRLTPASLRTWTATWTFSPISSFSSCLRSDTRFTDTGFGALRRKWINENVASNHLIFLFFHRLQLPSRLAFFFPRG